MKKFLLIAFCCCSQLLMAQAYWGFYNLDTIPCPYNTTQTIITEQDWELYYTLDDTWDGVRDSSICLSLKDTLAFHRAYLGLDNLPANRTIFIRRRLTDNNKIMLYENTLLGGDIMMNWLDNMIPALNYSNNCPNNVCTGFLVGVEIPADTSAGIPISATAMRWTTGAEMFNPADSINGFYPRTCVPTEYFQQGNFLREFIIKITPSAANQNRTIKLESASLEDSYPEQIKDSLEIYQDVNGAYNYDLWWPTLALYRDVSLYPKISNMTYIDLKPVPNSSTPITMNLNLNMYGSLIFQPFTDFKPSLVQGDSVTRHNYNIVNNGGNFCLSIFIDKPFKNGNNYIHKAGRIEFGGEMSCLEFGESSKLIVADGARLEYGTTGQGFLALRSRGSIEIGKEAELVINNEIILYEYYYDNVAVPIEMTLNEGSTLTFGRYSSISNEMSLDGTMHLKIYMKGGTIDYHHLSLEDRRLIELIYDEPEVIFNDNLKIIENPVSEQLRYSLTLKDKSPAFMQLVTATGQVVQQQQFDAQRGINYFEASMATLPNGIYFLNIVCDEGKVTKRVMVQR